MNTNGSSFNLHSFDRLLAKRARHVAAHGYGTERSLIFRATLGGATVMILSASMSLSFGALPEDTGMEVMTYNGMDLGQFAAFMELSVDDPYTIAVFEELCASEELLDAG